MEFKLAYAVATALAAAVGCGSQNPVLAPVQGRVTLDGAPVANMAVKFTPIGSTKGSGALGGSDEDGNYALTDVRGGDGAHPGEYKVSFYPINTAAGADDDPASVVASGSSSVPPIFIDPVRTPLRATVPPQGGRVDILLTPTGEGATIKTVPADQSATAN